MVARSLSEVEAVWLKVEGVKKMSDKIIPLPIVGGIGLDGLIAMLNNPVSGPLAPLGIAADELYTWGAGLYLIFLGTQVRASGWTLTRMFSYLVIDSVVGAIPWIGGAVDFFFRGHAYAAGALQKEIERTHWIDAAHARDDYDQHRADMKSERKRRMVFLKG